MKKFSEFGKSSKSSKSSKASKLKGKGGDRKNLPYEKEVNSNILKGKMPVKDVSKKQTNLKDTKNHSWIKSKKTTANDETDYETNKDGISQKKSLNENRSMKKKKRKAKIAGKVTKFPKNTKASKAYSFLENVKISKNKIWYILIEKQNDELQMIKYNTKKGVNLGQFVNELKKYYIEKFNEHKDELEKIMLGADKDGNFTSIKNIPNIKIEGSKLIKKITEDLTTLLNGKL